MGVIVMCFCILEPGSENLSGADQGFSDIVQRYDSIGMLMYACTQDCCTRGKLYSAKLVL